MSIETAAKDLASHITRHEQVEVLCHHDADGIAAGAIMGIALYRAHIPFRLRVTPRIQAADIAGGKNILLCDIGSGIADLPEETMVIDHHLPLFEGPYQVNPRLCGIDGDTELSGAGAAYLVANAIGDNRDLAGLALTGIIGDGQQLSGKNQEIYLEGMGNGIISKKRGIRLAGRDLPEKLLLATNPFIPGISGKESEASSLIARCTEDGKTTMDLLLSLLVLNAAESCRVHALYNLYGDCYQLEREVITDAHSMAMLIDACGKEGKGSIAASLCLRSSAGLSQGWEIATAHQLSVIAELHHALTPPQENQVYEVREKRYASDVADIVSTSLDKGDTPVIILVRQDDGNAHLSIRLPADLATRTTGEGLGSLVHTLAVSCGGDGGGHMTRAGATIQTEHLPRFISGIQEAFA